MVNQSCGWVLAQIFSLRSDLNWGLVSGHINFFYLFFFWGGLKNGNSTVFT